MTVLQRFLDERGWRQHELAARSGVSREAICRYANGSRKIQVITVAIAIAWALGVTLGDLEPIIGIHPSEWPIGPDATYVRPRGDWVRELNCGRDPWVEKRVSA